MDRSSKWLAGTDAEQSLTQVARKALRIRLKTVCHYMPLAAKKSHADIEYVHQLRVSTRRARAAVQVFQDLLPKRHAKSMKRRLRRLRQAAGAARDLDVLGERLRKLAKKKGSRLEAVVQLVAARRQAAQKSLRASCKDSQRRKLTTRSRELVKAIRNPRRRRESKFGEAARERLIPPVAKFFEAAAADLSDLEAMHQLRISGKRVRYAMELLGGAFDDSFRAELYTNVEELQERLGVINDHATAIVTFQELRKSSDCRDADAELVKLIEFEEQMLAEDRSKFEAWWTPERMAELSWQFDVALVTPAAAKADTSIEAESSTSGGPLKSA